MGISRFKAQKVFLDTAPLIYFIEGSSEHQDKLKQLFEALDKGDFTFLTSALTLMEVLVQPMKLGRQDLVEKYNLILAEASGMEIVEITTAIAIRAAEVRAKYGFKTPDAFQIAAAITHEAKLFLTNDLRLKTIKEISIVTLSEL